MPRATLSLVSWHLKAGVAGFLLIAGCSGNAADGGQSPEAMSSEEAPRDDPRATRPMTTPTTVMADETVDADQEPGTGSEPAAAPGEPAPDPASPNMDPAAAPGDCAEALPLQPLRRLSSTEYHNTLLDLFGEELGSRVVGESRFPATQVVSGFTSDAEANIVNTAESNAIEDNAEHIASLVDADPAAFLHALLPCSIGDALPDARIDDCIDQFIEQFGRRAFRRPPSETEVALARRVYDEARALGDAPFAFAALLQYFVQSPALLYRVERGVTEQGSALLRLDGYERATRLSYLLTGSMPDDELLAAAEADELATKEQVLAQAERLLEAPRFLDTAVAFHRDWLELHGFEYKEPAEFPDFDATRGSLEQATDRYVRYVLEEGAGTVEALLGGTILPVNATLGAYYGVDAPGTTDEEWRFVEVPNRRGLVTDAALMATLANSTATRPIHRGGFVQTQFLCRALPALPADVDTQGPLVDTSMLPTARERLSPLTERGDCSTCHSIINPVGLAFENYDAAGAWRDEENGSAIDAAGSLVLDGETVSFTGPLDLADAIATSDEARDCYALFWYRAAFGRPEFAEDECSLAALESATETSGGDVRQLLLALVQTDAFLMRSRDR